MRKVLSFVLVLSLVLGSFGMAFASTPLSDVAGEPSEDAVNVLTQLEVISGYTDGTYRPDNIVTRAEMAVIVVRALGLADYAIGTSNFKDMGGHWSNPYVAYATSLGVISGYPNGEFRPDKTVSYDEAATMLVAALGYTTDSLTGTWPANFVVKAKALGILDGIKAGAAGANRGNIAIMAYQTLDQEIGITNKDGEWKTNGTGDKTDTMLARLGATLYTPEFDDAKAGAAFVVTGEEKSIINLKPYLGAYVTAYANSDKEIIAIKEVKSVYITGEFDGTTFEADVNYNIASDAEHDQFKFFVNSVEDSTKGLDDVTNSEYTIAAKISGKKITAIYSVSEWKAEPSFLFDKDMVEEIDEDLAINGYVFPEDNNEEIDFKEFALLGIASLEDLKEDNVVTVYLEELGDVDSEIVRIEVGTDVVEGEVTKVTSATNPKVTVKGKAYSKADDYEALFDSYAWNNIDVEEEVALYLNYAGKVYTAELIDGTSADDYAIVLKTEEAGDGAITGKDALVELFLADGTTKVFDVADDVDAYDDTKAADSKWLVKSGDLVKFGVNNKGVVDALEEVTQLVPVNTKTKVTDKGAFHNRPVASKAVIFTYDGNETAGHKDWADDEKYGVTTLAKIKGNEYDDVKYLLDDTLKIEVMYILGEGDSGDEIYGVVTDKYKTSASDSGYMVAVLVDGKTVEYEVASETYYNSLVISTELQFLSFNSNGQLNKLTTVNVSFDDGDARLMKDGALTAAYSNNYLVFGASAADQYYVESGAVAYKWNADDEAYKLSSVSRGNLGVGISVKIYELKDSGIDIILID